MDRPNTVVFDIDGTLSPEISWLSLTRDLGASVEDHMRIYEEYKSGSTTYEQSKAELIQLWQATGNANRAFFTSIFEQLPLVTGAEDVMASVQDKHRVCLITGSMDLYAATVARKLHVTEWFANTSLHWNEADELVDMDYELNQDKKKLEQFLGFCSANSIEPGQCLVIGDSDNDVSLFKTSGRGIAVGTKVPEALVEVAHRTIGSLTMLPVVIENLQ